MTDIDLKQATVLAPTWIDIQKAIDLLKDDRIKLNTDFSIMLKYHEITVTTRVIYRKKIEDAFDYYGMKITNIFTF